MSLPKRIKSSDEKSDLEQKSICTFKITDTCPEKKCDGNGHVRYRTRVRRNLYTYTTSRCCSYAFGEFYKA